MYIDNKVYKQLINSKTPEEFWNNKSLLNINNNIELDKDDILIRSLSVNEYDKYIIKGTADGSISKYNVNTWHYNTTNPICYYFILGSINAQSCYNSIKSSCNLTKNYNEITVMGINQMPGYDSVFGRSYTLNSPTSINTELTQNNNSTFTETNKSNLIELSVQCYNYSSTGKHLLVNKVDKNKPTYTYSNFVNHYGEARLTVNYNFISCYRPVFNFIDNSKSTNIHY